jgi:hypothetical protein
MPAARHSSRWTVSLRISERVDNEFGAVGDLGQQVGPGTGMAAVIAHGLPKSRSVDTGLCPLSTR